MHSFERLSLVMGTQYSPLYKFIKQFDQRGASNRFDGYSKSKILETIARWSYRYSTFGSLKSLETILTGPWTWRMYKLKFTVSLAKSLPVTLIHPVYVLIVSYRIINISWKAKTPKTSRFPRMFDFERCSRRFEAIVNPSRNLLSLSLSTPTPGIHREHPYTFASINERKESGTRWSKC